MGKLSLKPHAIEAQLFFTETNGLTSEASHPQAQLSEVVQHFKRLSQETANLSKPEAQPQGRPALHDELWSPGFIEISEIPAQDPGL